MNKQLSFDLEQEKKRYTDLFLQGEAVKAELEALRELSAATAASRDASAAITRPHTEENTEENSVENANPATEPAHQESSVHVALEMKNICYLHAVEAGSCRRQRCKFSHSIKPEMSTNPEVRAHVLNLKEEKAAKCVNEFFSSGSCRKGMMCRFSHKISENHRNDPTLRRMMEDKYFSLTGRVHNNQHRPPLPQAGLNHEPPVVSSNIWAHQDHYQRETLQRTPHSLNNQCFVSGDVDQQHPPQILPHPIPVAEGPRPLMENLITWPTMDNQVNHAAQIQAVNLLQSLLSQMIATQFNVPGPNMQHEINP